MGTSGCTTDCRLGRIFEPITLPMSPTKSQVDSDTNTNCSHRTECESESESECVSTSSGLSDSSCGVWLHSYPIDNLRLDDHGRLHVAGCMTASRLSFRHQ